MKQCFLPEWSRAPVVEALQALRAACDWWPQPLWWLSSATSRASPIPASSWRISAWCHPSIPAVARDARAALPRPGTVKGDACSPPGPAAPTDSRPPWSASASTTRPASARLRQLPPDDRAALGCTGRTNAAALGPWLPPMPPRPAWRAHVSALFADTAMLRETQAGLRHPRVETDVADELLGVGNRRTSPIAAIRPAATMRFTPVMVSSRLTAGSLMAACAMSRSSTSRSSPSRSSSRRFIEGGGGEKKDVTEPIPAWTSKQVMRTAWDQVRMPDGIPRS